MDKPTFDPLEPSVVLAVAAHPDDIDVMAAGAVADFVSRGAKVYYYVLTDGASGSEDRTMVPEQLRDIRRAEQRAAGELLGLADVFFGDYGDGRLENTQDVKRDIVRAIRRVKPDVVITLDPAVLYVAERGIVNHPDHRAAGQAALDAIFPLARDHMSFPELLKDEGLEPHKVKTVLLSGFDGHGNFAVDISATIETKLKALALHDSQFADFDKMADMVRSWSEQAGEAYGVSNAETFTRIDIM